MNSVRSRPRFCVIDSEYSILTQNEMIVESYWHKKKRTKKQVTSYISTFKAAGNFTVNLKNYVSLLAWNQRAKWLAFYTMCAQVLFVSGIPCNSERDRSLQFQRSWYVLFVAFVFFCVGFIIKRQQKLSLFFTQKRIAVEENQVEGLDTSGAKGLKLTNTMRKFRPAWKT